MNSLGVREVRREHRGANSRKNRQIRRRICSNSLLVSRCSRRVSRCLRRLRIRIFWKCPNCYEHIVNKWKHGGFENRQKMRRYFIYHYGWPLLDCAGDGYKPLRIDPNLDKTETIKIKLTRWIRDEFSANFRNRLELMKLRGLAANTRRIRGEHTANFQEKCTIIKLNFWWIRRIVANFTANSRGTPPNTPQTPWNSRGFAVVISPWVRIEVRRNHRGTNSRKKHCVVCREFACSCGFVKLCPYFKRDNVVIHHVVNHKICENITSTVNKPRNYSPAAF